MKRRRRMACWVGLAVVTAFGVASGMPPAVATIDSISPGSLTIAAGDSGSAQVAVSSAAGSCLTASADVSGIDVGVSPGCAPAGTPVFTLTVIVEPGISAGDYNVDIREFDGEQDQLIDTSTLGVQVDGVATTTTTSTTTTTTAAPTTTTTAPTTTETPTATTSSTTTSTTTAPPATTTTAASAAGTTLPPVTTVPPTTVPPSTSTTSRGEATTTTAGETAVRPLVETGLSPWLTGLAIAVLAMLTWLIVRAGRDEARVRYRSLINPDRLGVLHQTFRDAGQGAPAAIRAGATSSRPLDAAIRPLAGPAAAVDVEVLVGFLWSRQRARIVATKTDGVMQLMVQRGEAGLADVPGSAETAETWLEGLASDLESKGDGRGSAAIRRWLTARR